MEQVRKSLLHSTVIILYKYQVLIDYFFRTIADVVHTPGLGCRLGRCFCLRQRCPLDARTPFKLVGRFQSFGHSFRFRHLLYCLKKRFLCVLINLLEIAFKCTVRSFFFQVARKGLEYM